MATPALVEMVILHDGVSVEERQNPVHATAADVAPVVAPVAVNGPLSISDEDAIMDQAETLRRSFQQEPVDVRGLIRREVRKQYCIVGLSLLLAIFALIGQNKQPPVDVITPLTPTQQPLLHRRLLQTGLDESGARGIEQRGGISANRTVPLYPLYKL